MGPALRIANRQSSRFSIEDRKHRLAPDRRRLPTVSWGLAREQAAAQWQARPSWRRLRGLCAVTTGLFSELRSTTSRSS